ncbi:MAG: hypothetical protein SGBAC_003125, partial [Bacillariaceae sp.]
RLMEEEDLFQTLNEVESAMTNGINEGLEDIACAEEEGMSLGSDMDTEFLNEYESTFNFIDSELDALRSSIDDTKPSLSGESGGVEKNAADDSSYSSSSDRSPFQMPAIDENFLNIGMESEIESEGEEEIELEMKKTNVHEEEKDMEQERKVERIGQVAEAEFTEDIDTQEETSVDASIKTAVQGSAEHSVEDSSASLETHQSPTEPQVKLEAARPQVPPLDQTNKPSHSFHLFTTLISIVLAFLTGQRFPKQDRYQPSPSLEMPSLSMQQPQDFQAMDWNHFEDDLFTEAEYCEGEEFISFVETQHLFESDSLNQTEAIESLSGEKAAHAAAIHEALNEQEEYYQDDSIVGEIEKEETEDNEFYFEETDFYYEDIADADTYEFGEIAAAAWDTPKLLDMMQNHNMDTVFVVDEEPFANQSINLHFGITEYEGLFISMEMMQFAEPLCLL